MHSMPLSKLLLIFLIAALPSAKTIPATKSPEAVVIDLSDDKAPILIPFRKGLTLMQVIGKEFTDDFNYPRRIFLIRNSKKTNYDTRLFRS